LIEGGDCELADEFVEAFLQQADDLLHVAARFTVAAVLVPRAVWELPRRRL
jgi:hypothetical protein